MDAPFCIVGCFSYKEVPGSAGTTNVFNLVSGRVDMPFSLKKGSEVAQDNGRLSIVRCAVSRLSDVI